MQVREDRRDAVGEAVAAGDEVAGDDDDVGLQLVDPAHVLDQVPLPDDGAVVQVGDLNDLQTIERRVEPAQWHTPAVNLDPPSVHWQRVNAGQPHAVHRRPDRAPPAVLAPPLRMLQKLYEAFDHVWDSINGRGGERLSDAYSIISSAA